jgi:hypothetical protein
MIRLWLPKCVCVCVISLATEHATNTILQIRGKKTCKTDDHSGSFADIRRQVIASPSYTPTHLVTHQLNGHSINQDLLALSPLTWIHLTVTDHSVYELWKKSQEKEDTKEATEGGISMVGVWQTVVGITDAWWRLVPFLGWPQITDIKHTASSRRGGPGNWLPHCHMLAAISLRWWCIYTLRCSLLLYTWRLSAKFGAEDPPKYVLANCSVPAQAT